MTAAAVMRALGTSLQVVVTDPACLEPAERRVREVFDAVDLAASRFRDDSDLHRINAQAGRPVTVSTLCLDAVLVALRAAEATDGVVDPTVAPALAAIGYDRDFAEVGGRGGRGVAAAGWRRVDADAASGTVRVPEGAALDLGATAKAFAADRAAAAAAAMVPCGVLVNAGGDVAVAGPPPAGGWRVRVTDDHAAAGDAPGQTVAMHGGGLATSSTTVRRWLRGSGDPAHHIVDPRTGEPAPVVWRTVSVAAGTCAGANTATTAAIVLGDAAIAWLEQRGYAARLVAAGGETVHLGGWPEAGEQA